MISEALIEQTITRFPGVAKGKIEIEPVEKGGSDRKFYRIRFTSEHSLILVKYGEQREENRHYVEIDTFLASLGVRVPKIYFQDESEKLIWMEDLGSRDLWSYRAESWARRFPLYRSALDQILLIHSMAHPALPKSPVTLQPGFDAELYRWEQAYFFENCLERFFRVEPSLIEKSCDRDRLSEIAGDLASQPRVLVHRDFQSQNILIKNGEAYLIDFQGMRYGLAQYDLASLLYDPYVALTSAERDELLGYYISQSLEAGVALSGNFAALLDFCAMQRLMQALGAYGFLGLVKKRGHFLAHIPSAIASLKEVLTRIPDLPNLRGLLEDLKP
jgi:aminoglycoside/choline kinase family phosphotransferase